LTSLFLQHDITSWKALSSSKRIRKAMSFPEMLNHLNDQILFTRQSHEAQKLFVVKAFWDTKSFQKIGEKITTSSKIVTGSKKSMQSKLQKLFKTGSKFLDSQESSVEFQEFTDIFSKKSDQISEICQGIEGVCRLVSLFQPLDHFTSQRFVNGEENSHPVFSDHLFDDYIRFFSQSDHLFSSLTSRLHVQRLMFLKSRNLHHIEHMMDHSFGNDTVLIPCKIQSRTRSAHFLCQTAIQQFQRNQSFRQIYKALLKDVQADPHVQGIRFVCSGRFGGVEMARVESRKYGQTSLHVFSSHIDYAHGHAMTSSGLLGVKIWISYRPMITNSSSWRAKWSNETESSSETI